MKRRGFRFEKPDIKVLRLLDKENLHLDMSVSRRAIMRFVEEKNGP